MRLIKSFLIGLTGLFCMATLLSLLIPSNIIVSRTVLINTGKGKVYQQAAILKNWKNWNPLFKSDSVKIVYSADSSSCDILNNNLKTKLSFLPADTALVKFIFQTEGEPVMPAEIHITPVPMQTGTQVEWKSVVKLKWYPWEKMYGIFVDKLTGPGYEAALNGLKNYLEQPPQ